MSKLFRFFSDPHLGVSRKAHTTKQSAKRLQDLCFAYALAACEDKDGYTTGLAYVAMLGDLFDTSHNPERILLQGHAVASHCDLVLAGNHDLENREGVVTSLNALAELDDSNRYVVAEDLDTPTAKIEVVNNEGKEVQIVSVPHHASQAVFDKALTEACSLVTNCGPSILLLHCNFDLDFAVENDATLNLSREQAEELLETFDYVLSGHEHCMSTHYEGRLIMLGNTFPTSFSDISDKYVWNYDADLNKMKAVCVWRKSDHYIEIPYQEGIDVSSITGLQSAHFIDVVGTSVAAKAVDISDFMNKLREAAPDALAIRQNVEILDALSDVAVAEKPSLIDLSAQISNDLCDTDIADLWEELSKEASK